MKKHVILLFMAVCSAWTFAAKPVFVDRVEPQSWWAGMAHNELQLMLHGENIASAEVSSPRSLPVLRVEKTDNPNFLFVYLDTKKASAGVYKINVKIGRKRQTIEYVLHERTAGSAERVGFDSSDAFYLLMPDRFANGNPENDNVKGYYQGTIFGNLDMRQGGDIQGIIDHLDHIADLGCTVLWTTPLLDDNDRAYSYHHYACTDYYKIDPRFGMNEDYKRLADECHKHGLKLVMDIVPNHCGTGHWWMEDMPAKDWFHQWPQFTRTNHNVSVWTNPEPAEYDLTLLEKGWFDTNMPDFNLANPLVFDYLRQAYTYWLEYAGIDGLRVDTYPYTNIFDAAKLMRAFNKEYPNMNIVGECWVKSIPQTAFFQTGAKNKNGFDSGLQSVMDFTLKDFFEWVYNENESWDRGTIRFYDHFANNDVYPNVNMVMNMLDNHDMNRFPAVVNRDVRLVKMGLAMLTTIRGYPQIYYGDEIMISGDKGRYEDARHTFPGGWAQDKHNAFDPAQRTAEENEVYNYLKALLEFRKDCPALHTGAMRQFLPYDGIYVYFRYDEKEKVMVIVNNLEEERTVDLKRYNEMDIIGQIAVDVVAQEAMILGDTLKVPAKTVLVLDIKEN